MVAETGSMADRFVSIPRVFDSGDFEEWLERYEICAAVNEWKEKALRLPTLLEKEALAVYLELDEETRKEYQALKGTLMNSFQPPETRFIALDEFESRKILPGESPQEFLHVLKQRLAKAIPNMDRNAREQLLLHRFLSGLPQQIAKSVRVSPEVNNTTEALKRVKLLMLCQPEYSVAPIADKTSEEMAKDTKLDELEAKLDRVLAGLAEEKSPIVVVGRRNFGGGDRIRCYNCQALGHIAVNCPHLQRNRRAVCYLCGKTGHIRRTCPLNSSRPTGRVTGRSYYQNGPKSD